MSRNEVVTKNRTVDVVLLPALSVAVTVSSCRPRVSSYMACSVPVWYARRPASRPTDLDAGGRVDRLARDPHVLAVAVELAVGEAGDDDRRLVPSIFRMADLSVSTLPAASVAR